MANLNKDCSRIILGEDEIQARVKELGAQIGEDYAGRDLIIVCLLKGAVNFAVDLARSIEGANVQMDFMVASSYGDTTESSGTVLITKDITTDVSNKDVIIVDDIIDTGRTMKRIQEVLRDRNPRSVELAAFLLKDRPQEEPIAAKYVGFECPNEFVVGYGLDYAQDYRWLPYVAVLKPEVYARA